MTPEHSNPVEVFYSYAHEDEELRDELEKHLANLKRQGVITDWYDRDITAGKGWKEEIKRHIDSAKVILLLISPNFINSDYINDIEVMRAMERHQSGEARVIPVILRPVDWQGTPFDKLQALPADAKPVTVWADRDSAFLNIAQGIRQALQGPSAPSTLSRAANIPRPPSVGFVDRRDTEGRYIVERLKEELTPNKNQLIALSGPGGVGKTTLAAQAARVLMTIFQDRIVWTSTDGREDFALSTFLDDVATQLGRADLRPLRVDQKTQEIEALIGETPVLIVLDNFETISESERARCLDFLANRASCPALITSRQRIGSARNITISAMSQQEANEFLQRLIEQARDPAAFEEAIRDRIFEASDRNPLVLQWLVAQIDLAQDVESVLNELASGGGDAAQRVFDRSFDLKVLGRDGQDTLLALSLFAPDASRMALAEVTGFGDDPERLNLALNSLSSLYLVKTVAAGSRLLVEGLTRALAKRRLMSDVRADDFRRRFIAHFLTYSELHSEPTPEDYDSLEAERDNLVTAAEAAIGLNDGESTRRIVDTIANPVTGVLVIHGYWDEAAKLNERALIVSQGSDADIAVFANNLAMIRANQGELDEARRLYHQSLEIEKKLGNDRGLAATLHNVALLSQLEGQLDEARQLYIQSLEIERKLGNESGIAVTLQQLGVIAQRQGELEEARQLYIESLEIKRKLGDQIGIISALNQLGTLAEQKRELLEAEHLFAESLKIAKSLRDQRSIASILHNLASLAQRQHKPEEAEKLYEESLFIKQRLGDLRGMASTLHNLALLARYKGDSERARELYQQSLAIAEKIGDKRFFESSLASLSAVEELEPEHQRAEWLMREGRWHEARAILLKNKNEFRRLRDRMGFARTLLALAQSEHAIGDLERARWTFKDALDHFQRLDDRYVAITSAYLGRLELQTGLVKDAMTHLEKAKQYFAQEQDHQNLAIVDQLLEVTNELARKQVDDEDWFDRTKSTKKP